SDRPDADALRQEAMALRERRKSLAALVADGTLSADDVRAEAKKLAGRIEEIEAALADVGRVRLLRPFVGADADAAWAEADTDRRRSIIDLLMTVVVHPVGRGKRGFDPATVELTPKL